MKNVFLMMMLFVSAVVCGQDRTDSTRIITKEEIKTTSPVDVTYVVTTDYHRGPDHLPEYPGGEWAMMKFIRSRMKHATIDSVSRPPGAIQLSFMVEKNGLVGMVYRPAPKYNDADKELLHILSKLHFKPATFHGEPVPFTYTTLMYISYK